MAKDLEPAPDDESIWQPEGLENSPAALAAAATPGDPPTRDVGRSSRHRPPSIQFVLRVVGLVALTVIAVALVVIAVDQTRQTRIMKRADCTARALDYRPDTFALTPTHRADVAKACGSKNLNNGP